MLDKGIVGRQYAPFSIEVEKGRISAFARAIGETNPIHHDESAAQAAGYRSLVAPLTFPFTLIMDADEGFRVLDDLKIDKARSVHGEQSFTFHAPICAGDTISGWQRIVDFAEKKGGALQIITTEIYLANQSGKPVCDIRMMIVVRNG